ncbi:MAG: glycine zipper domain-containing protein [Aeromicrobium sp.]
MAGWPMSFAPRRIVVSSTTSPLAHWLLKTLLIWPLLISTRRTVTFAARMLRLPFTMRRFSTTAPAVVTVWSPLIVRVGVQPDGVPVLARVGKLLLPGAVGDPVGAVVGVLVGAVVGAEVGAVVGALVGALVGLVVGAVVGPEVGAVVGVEVGDGVVGASLVETTTSTW